MVPGVQAPLVIERPAQRDGQNAPAEGLPKIDSGLEQECEFMRPAGRTGNTSTECQRCELMGKCFGRGLQKQKADRARKQPQNKACCCSLFRTYAQPAVRCRVDDKLQMTDRGGGNPM